MNVRPKRKRSGADQKLCEGLRVDEISGLDDRRRWNDRYRARPNQPAAPSQVLLSHTHCLPEAGNALDVAGGSGRNALWLAARGLEVTLVDISDVAIEIAAHEAAARGLPLATLRRDIAVDGPPAGPWDLILCVSFLDRPLYARLGEHLSPQGRLVVIHPTRRNLERHRRPPPHFLLNEGELPELVGDLRIVHHAEGWQDDEHHLAVLVATPHASPTREPGHNSDLARSGGRSYSSVRHDCDTCSRGHRPSQDVSARVLSPPHRRRARPVV